MFGFLFGHLAAVLLVAASAIATGALLTGSLRFAGSLERSVFRAAIGLGALASGVHVLGLLGAIRPIPVAALFAAPLVVASLRRGTPGDSDPAVAPRDRFLQLALVFGLLPAAILALYPPTAFDATLYHLPFARAFATLHATAFLPALRYPVFPQALEMLYAAALTVSDDVTAQLIHFLCLALTAAALVAWGRRFATGRAGTWAGAAWLGSPIVIATGAAAYVDAGLALFCTLCLYAWTVARQTGDRRFLGWSAALAGFAASTKYHGLFLVVAIPAAILISGGRAAVRRALAYLGIAMVVLSPFYARIVSQTGNPLFPFLSGWFGKSAWAESLGPVSTTGGSDAWLRRLTRPRDVERTLEMLFLPGTEAPRRAPLSPLLLFVPPLVAGVAVADRRQRAVAGVLLIYGLGCFALTPSPRHFFPILPAAALLATSFAERLVGRPGIPPWRRERPVAAALALVLILPGAAFAWRKIWLQGPLPVTHEARETYLDRQVAVHGALRSLNEARGNRYTVYCLYCESAAYYADGEFLGDYFGPYAFARVEVAMGAGRSLHAALRRMGVTHLLVKHSPPETPLPADPAFAELFTPMPAPPGVSLFALR